MDGILEFCQGLSALPKRGAGRGELRCSFLTITYRKSAVVFYRVDETEVIISAIYYSGQGYEIVEE